MNIQLSIKDTIEISVLLECTAERTARLIEDFEGKSEDSDLVAIWRKDLEHLNDLNERVCALYGLKVGA